MRNYLSIDLESWASPNLPEFIHLSSREKKLLDNGHIKKSTIYILRILKKYNTKITFFVVGQLYEWYPEVVEMIASQEHEIAYHTHAHDVLTNKDTLIESIKKSKKFLQRYKPVGFRAPRIYGKNTKLKILKNYGFKYDSSIYGSFLAKRKMHGVLELPVTSIKKIPIGSGYFIGMLGKKMRWIYEVINKKGDPVISFIHNWQVLKPIKPTFPTRAYIMTHPYYIPYLINCSSAFEYLVKHLSLEPMKNLIK